MKRARGLASAGNPVKQAELEALTAQLNPFVLAAQVERELKRIEAIRRGREA